MSFKLNPKYVGFGLFFFSLFFYIRTAAPHLAPYRDAGEMASVIHLLGVAHPPGYPLYTLVGRFSDFLLYGNDVYQINIFSCLCASIAVVVLFLTLSSWLSTWGSFLSSLFLIFCNPFWELALVSEMYSLGVLWLAFILYSLFILKNEILLFFLMGLGLGVRMDLLLLLPVLGVWFWKEKIKFSWKYSLLGFLIGLSVYSYLPIRSGVNPVLDWGNPDTLMGTFASATRKSYSGTLDLLSLSYKTGENFLLNLRLYIVHLLESLGLAAVLLIPIGFWRIYLIDKKKTFLFSILFLVIGPLFLFLANMPPNPHSLAIVEASYLFPDFILIFFLAFGVSWVLSLKWKKTISFLLLLSLFFNISHGYARANKRNNFYLRDFIENIWRSLPENAIAVFRKDVQLFSLWESQLLDKKRLDVSLIAAGLSASPWYWNMKTGWPSKASPSVSLKEADGWQKLKLLAGSRGLYAGYDAEFSGGPSLRVVPNGLLMRILLLNEESSGGDDVFWRHMALFRGRDVYGETPDFFTTDLIGDLSKAYHQQGFFKLINKIPGADWYFMRAAYLDPTFARPFSDLGYWYYEKGEFGKALWAFDKASDRYRRIFLMAERYKSLPDVVAGYKTDYSTTLTYYGVVYEKINEIEKARQCYWNSLELAPNAQAHYNLAVTYWGKDWNVVVKHLSAAIKLNPQMEEAKGYLSRAKIFLNRQAGNE